MAPKLGILDDIAVPNDVEENVLVTPLDAQNTTVGNVINLYIKDRYSANISLNGLQQGVIMRVVTDPKLFEYSQRTEIETLNKQNYVPVRYKVYISGLAGSIFSQPKTWNDLAIDALDDYSAAPNFQGALSEKTIVYVDRAKRVIHYTADSSVYSSAANAAAQASTSNPSGAFQGPNNSPTVIGDKPPPIEITEEKLKKIFPRINNNKCKLYAKVFNDILPTYEINSARRIAAFLGQIGVESGELKYDKELPSKYNKKDPNDQTEPTGTLYEGRKNLGNIQEGDGPKYIGRGILQITGRANYESMGKKLGVPLVENPDLALDPIVSTKVACEFFKSRNLISLSDDWNLEKITERVNGRAKLHYEQRVKYSENALKILSE